MGFYSDRNLTKIKNLPSSLTSFLCGYNKIEKIENLPSSLRYFDCDNNQITKIENLPSSLTNFWCGCNKIEKIENLPSSLTHFYCYNNLIKYVDNLEIKRFNNGKFDLDMYQTFKRLQRRIRWRYNRKNKAVRVIQNGCHNWLWSVKCKDGTLGINPKLSFQKLKN